MNNVEAIKTELVGWIKRLHDRKAIERVMRLKAEMSTPSAERQFGSGKALISFIADDFNDPIEVFRDYEK